MDGKLRETHVIPSDNSKLLANRKIFKEFCASLGNHNMQDKTNSYLFTDVSWQKIQDFVLRYQFHDELFDLNEIAPEFIKKTSDIYPKWDVILKSNDKVKQPEEGYMISAQVRNIGHEGNNKSPSPRPAKIPRGEPGWYTGDKDRFSGNSIFAIGLSKDQLDAAKNYAANTGQSRASTIYSDYTNIRGKPVLILHLLHLIDKEQQDKVVLSTVPAISINFPHSSEFRTVEYVVGPVWLKQFEQDHYDSPDEEDDYDLE